MLHQDPPDKQAADPLRRPRRSGCRSDGPAADRATPPCKPDDDLIDSHNHPIYHFDTMDHIPPEQVITSLNDFMLTDRGEMTEQQYEALGEQVGRTRFGDGVVIDMFSGEYWHLEARWAADMRAHQEADRAAMSPEEAAILDAQDAAMAALPPEQYNLLTRRMMAAPPGVGLRDILVEFGIPVLPGYEDDTPDLHINMVISQDARE